MQTRLRERRQNVGSDCYCMRFHLQASLFNCQLEALPALVFSLLQALLSCRLGFLA